MKTKSKQVLIKTIKGFIKEADINLERMEQNYKVLGKAIPLVRDTLEKDKQRLKELNGS